MKTTLYVSVALLTAIVFVKASSAGPANWIVERYYVSETWSSFADIGKKDNGGPGDVYTSQQSLTTTDGHRVGVVNGFGVNLREAIRLLSLDRLTGGGHPHHRRRDRPDGRAGDLPHHRWHRALRRNPRHRHDDRRRQEPVARGRALRTMTMMMMTVGQGSNLRPWDLKVRPRGSNASSASSTNCASVRECLRRASLPRTSAVGWPTDQSVELGRSAATASASSYSSAVIRMTPTSKSALAPADRSICDSTALIGTGGSHSST